MEITDQISAWQTQLGAIGGTNPLLRFELSSFGQVDLARSHPGGLAQLVSARSTTLSNLVRDGVALGRAQSATRRILRKARRIESNFGMAALYVVGGLVSLDGKRLPIILWRSHVLERGDDYEIRIESKPEINPALVEVIKRHRPAFVEQDLVAVASSQSDLVPVGALTLVQQYLQDTSAEIESLLVLGNFVPDLIHLSQQQLPQERAALDFLVGQKEATSNPTSSPVTLVAEADSSQRQVLRRAQQGESFAIHTLPGCGYLQTVVNLISNFALEGKRVLLVAPRKQTLDELAERLSHHGLGGLAVRASDAWKDSVAAISRNEKAAAGDVLGAKNRYSSAKKEIESYFSQVQQADGELGVSLIDCLEQLALLSGKANPPVNAARIKHELLGSIRGNVDELIGKAHEADIFAYAPKKTPWFGSRFESQVEIDQLLGKVRSLAGENWRVLSYQISKYLSDLSLSESKTVEDWSVRLRLLLGIRHTLDRFLPSIYDRPLDELIAATAPRGSRGDLSGSQRRRFKKLAKEFVRPGSSVPNLHQALIAAQEQRVAWNELNETNAPPTVPLGLADAQSKFESISEVLEALQKHLNPDPDAPLLSRMAIDDLGKHLDQLAEDTEILDQYMDRKPIQEALVAAGLGSFAKELASIQPTLEQAKLEFELTWWQSALEAVVQRNPNLMEYSAERLAILESEFEEAGHSVIEEGAKSVRHTLGERWRQALVRHPAQADRLRSQMRTRTLSLKEGYDLGGELWKQLVPAVMTTPYRLGELAKKEKFDAVVVLDAASTGVPEALVALSKAEQVLAFGDPVIATPEDFDTVARANSDTLVSERQSVYDLVSRRCGVELISHSYRMEGQVLGHYLNQNFYDDELILEPSAGQLFGEHNFEHFEVKEGATTESTIEGSTESMDAEVQKVAELVISHARWHPEDSLMVVTASKSHADRVSKLVEQEVAKQPSIAEFFDANGRERFDCVTMGELTHRLADRVIFSVGFGRTPEGRISQTLGDFNSENAGRWMVNQIVSARKRLSVVSCYNFEDFAGGSLPENQRWLKDLIAPSFLSDVQDGEPDPLLSDLAKRLEKLGIRVSLNFASRIGLAASYGKKAAAIDADWALTGNSWDEKLRLRPGLLRAMGWQYHRVHALEIFAKPQEVANRIAISLGMDLRSRVEPLFDPPAFEDTARAWGDPDDSNDDRLRDDKPPHWG